ncbi:MAG: hypothetical protein H0T76_28015 [Nannocystis sp.]|nr:hypothetical protein [Nannocystis sp.]MBA3550338.1 hypothetical protein [Nannocystis sp.]
MMRRGRVQLGRLLLATFALPLACSTLASPEPVETCVSDDDCDKASGEICGAGTCYPSNLPPRDEVALELTVASLSGSFRLELHGPDRAVERVDTRPIRYHVNLDNNGEVAGVRDELRLSVFETYRFGDQVAEIPLRATLTPTQSSRLGTPQPKVVPLGFDPLNENDVPLDPVPAIVLPWAHYDSNDKSPSYTSPAPEPERPLLVTISPADVFNPMDNSDIQRGIVYRQLVREQQALAGTHAFALHTDRDCHRKLHGTALVVGTGTPPPVSIGVELVHARRTPADGPVCDPEPATGTPAVCSPQTLARASGYKPVPCTAKNQCPQQLGCYPTGDDDGSRVCGCDTDAECPTSQVCEQQSHRCALDLASPDLGTGGLGLTATEGGVATKVETSDFEAWVYTYCEDDLQGDREMEFVVRATPSSPGGDVPPPLPPLSFHTSVDFLWQNGELPRAELKQNMCFPDWSAPQPLAFDVSSAPQELYRGAGNQPFVCCSATCLDLTKPAASPPASCRLAATLTARTVFTPDPELWSTFSCMELDVADTTVPAGSQRITYGFDQTKCSDGPCNINLSAGTDKLEYELRVEPPQGSLIRSMVLPTPLVVDTGTTSVVMPKLEYRVLLRGRVTVTPEDCPAKPSGGASAIDCPRASILAERLKVAGEEPALAPLYLTAATIPGSYGDFVLAVNPGVYLVTALPASGSPGGPADIRVVDLRLDSKLVDTSGPIPIADLDSPLSLDVGKLVTVELEGFGRSSKAVPLDVGYWAAKPLRFNGVTLNLNDPATCYGSLNRGCQIRRLRLAGSFLSLTQESYVKYLARGALDSE